MPACQASLGTVLVATGVPVQPHTESLLKGSKPDLGGRDPAQPQVDT